MSCIVVTSARWLLSDGNGPCAYDGCENDADLLVGVEKNGAAATIRLCERCDQANHIHAADVAGDAS